MARRMVVAQAVPARFTLVRRHMALIMPSCIRGKYSENLTIVPKLMSFRYFPKGECATSRCIVFYLL